MVVVDAMGLMLYNSGNAGPSLISFSQSYSNYLRRLGGTASFAMGSLAAFYFGITLQPPVGLPVSGSSTVNVRMS